MGDTRKELSRLRHPVLSPREWSGNGPMRKAGFSFSSIDLQQAKFTMEDDLQDDIIPDGEPMALKDRLHGRKQA